LHGRPAARREPQRPLDDIRREATRLRATRRGRSQDHDGAERAEDRKEGNATGRHRAYGGPVEATAALARITAHLEGSEDRPGQQAMTAAVEDAMKKGTVLLVEAGTGTGKSLGYLVPAVLSGKKPVVVATATKALQDQLLGQEIPAVAAGLGREVDAVAVKGRGSYLCRAKEVEVRSLLDLEG